MGNESANAVSPPTGEAVAAPSPRVLVVEDEALFAKAVRKRLTKSGYECELAPNLAQAEACLKAFDPDLITLDMRLPDGSGLDFLKHLREDLEWRKPVLVMTAYGDVDDAVVAMKFQASDYLKKPIDLDELLVNVEKVLAKAEVEQRLERSQVREQVGGNVDNAGMLGEDPCIVTLREQAMQIASLAPEVDVPPPTVLILGETGTGKDVLARMLHANSARASEPFVHVDCAALPKDLIEAELFGHERGAFTNAHTERTGLLEAAERGAVFLDEIGELPLELQAKLLAVLERRMLRRVGSSRERPVAAWFIAATNRDLLKMSEAGEFRSDLYYRLDVLTLKTPRLADRGADVLLLARHFAAQTSSRYGLAAPELAADAEQALLNYGWPGNVRELRHLTERAVLLARGRSIRAVDFALDVPGESARTAVAAGTGSPAAFDLDNLTLDEAELLLINHALEQTNHNVSEAARRLGITRMTMRYRMKKHDIDG